MSYKIKGPTYSFCGTFSGQDGVSAASWSRKLEYELSEYKNDTGITPPARYLDALNMLLTEEAEEWADSHPEIIQLLAKTDPNQATVDRFQLLFFDSFPSEANTAEETRRTSLEIQMYEEQRRLDKLQFYKQLTQQPVLSKMLDPSPSAPNSGALLSSSSSNSVTYGCSDPSPYAPSSGDLLSSSSNSVTEGSGPNKRPHVTNDDGATQPTQGPQQAPQFQFQGDEERSRKESSRSEIQQPPSGLHPPQAAPIAQFNPTIGPQLQQPPQQFIQVPRTFQPLPPQVEELLSESESSNKSDKGDPIKHTKTTKRKREDDLAIFYQKDTKKLQLRWRGPFRISGYRGSHHHSFTLKQLSGRGIRRAFYGGHLKRFAPRTEHLAKEEGDLQLPPIQIIPYTRRKRKKA